MTNLNQALASELAALESEVTKAREQNDSPALIQALIQLGQSYLQMGNTPKALTQFEEALELAQAGDDQALTARLWGYKGICLVKLGNSHFSQIALYKSYNMAKALDNKAIMIDALTQLGLLQLDGEQPTKAISKLEQAMGHAMAIGDQPRLMHLAGRLGNIFLGLSSVEKAVEYYSLAIQAAEKNSNQRAICSYKLGIGQAYFINKEYGLARELFEEALAIAGETDDPQAERSGLSGLMRVAMATDNVSMVTLYGQQIVRMTAEAGAQSEEIETINLLSVFLLQRQLFKKALPLLQRGLALADENSDWDWQLTMHERLGMVYYQLERLPDAQQHYQDALECALHLQDPRAASHLYGRISAVLAEQNQMQDALVAGKQALKLAQQQDDADLTGEQQILLAFTYAEMNDVAQALDYCQQGIATLQQTDSTDLLQKAESLHAELLAIAAVAAGSK